jgi:hypothetical protein
MAHHDNLGESAKLLRRATFLISAELIRRRYRKDISAKHLAVLDQFVVSFRKFRRSEAEYANKVLELFTQNDIKTVEGHVAILRGWLNLHELAGVAVPATYQREGGRYFHQVCS